ncbi:hypothetical protein TIFTF001_021649 [Ficus carica]|uniref:Uncharacterized protein n=1 Tax=Ficus carica TaxID=3494 RepID=A0AA88DAY6_FICCA|nr:hypothetical protein TIFTF001_021649 [Ficus carica]
MLNILTKTLKENREEISSKLNPKIDKKIQKPSKLAAKACFYRLQCPRGWIAGLRSTAQKSRGLDLRLDSRARAGDLGLAASRGMGWSYGPRLTLGQLEEDFSRAWIAGLGRFHAAWITRAWLVAEDTGRDAAGIAGLDGRLVA